MQDLHLMRLWDLYAPMLTENQREITDLYFNCDLSLGEIAEQKGVSRQSVSDCLNKCRKQLEEAEGKLHFLRIVAQSSLGESCLRTDILRWLEQAKGRHPDWEEWSRLQEILDCDYTEEVNRLIELHKDTLL